MLCEFPFATLDTYSTYAPLMILQKMQVASDLGIVNHCRLREPNNVLGSHFRRLRIDRR